MVVIAGILLAAFIIIFWVGAQQARKPTGKLGEKMVALYEKTYLTLFQWALVFLPHQNNAIVLDIGVGSGASSKILLNHFMNASVYSIDYSEKAIEVAKQNNAAEIQSGHMQVQQADVSNLPFENNFFTHATAFQTHFHWQDFTKGMIEICRVVKPGGTVLLACEKNKINYYMKAFSDEEQARMYFEHHGFCEVKLHTEDKWIAFEMLKS